MVCSSIKDRQVRLKGTLKSQYPIVPQKLHILTIFLSDDDLVECCSDVSLATDDICPKG